MSGGSSPAAVKSVQRGVIAIAAAVNSGTATISSVDTDKAAARNNGNDMNDTTATTRDEALKVVLTSATVVTASRVSAVLGAVNVAWEVTEYN